MSSQFANYIFYLYLLYKSFSSAIEKDPTCPIPFQCALHDLEQAGAARRLPQPKLLDRQRCGTHALTIIRFLF